MFGFNLLIFYTETSNNYTLALGGLGYLQFCARTTVLAMEACQSISGYSIQRGWKRLRQSRIWAVDRPQKNPLVLLLPFIIAAVGIYMKEVLSYPASIKLSCIIIQ